MILRGLLVGLAAVAAIVPYPAGLVERFYTRGLYPEVQPVLTGASNAVPVAVLDLVAALLVTFFIVIVVRRWRQRGLVSAVGRALTFTLTTGAVLYLLFLVTWGLNYRRIPLESKLVFARERISEQAAMRLATTAVERVNALHLEAHAATPQDDHLLASLQEVHWHLGGTAPILAAHVKPSLLELYFRQAAIDGMTVPVALEVILNPDLLPVERPFTWAHEQAHIAGYADESEANFVAWLACVRAGDPLARYSGWLDAYRLAANAVPRGRRKELPPLADGPREDLRAIALRYDRSSPAIRDAARSAYDSYLRANRIDEGIENYGVVLQLLLGTEFSDDWTPKVR